MSWYPSTQFQLLQVALNHLLPTLDGAEFAIATKINGQAVLVLIDTGASTSLMQDWITEPLGPKLHDGFTRSQQQRIKIGMGHVSRIAIVFGSLRSGDLWSNYSVSFLRHHR